MELRVEVTGTEEMTQKAERFPSLFQTRMTAAVRKALLPVLQEALRAAPVDQGALRASIAAAGVRIDAGEGYVEGIVGSGSNYGPYVEFGTGQAAVGGPYQDFATGPPTVPRKAPPIDAILPWVHRHQSMVADFLAKHPVKGKTKKDRTASAERALAFLIQRKIREDGTDPKDYLVGPFVNHRDDMAQIMFDAFQSLLTEI